MAAIDASARIPPASPAWVALALTLGVAPWSAVPVGGQVRAPDAAEARTRIWGRVTTVSGRVHEGFLRWDRNEASWADLLNGAKSSAPEPFLDWSPAPGAAPDRAARVIEFGRYRITWDDTEADMPATAESGVRFGHLRSIRVLGGDSVVLVLRSGSTLGLNEREVITKPEPGVTHILAGGSTDLGEDLRELLVDVPGGEAASLKWEDLAEVSFARAPDGALPRDSRLHGTVEDRWGTRYTGFIAWNNNQALTSDTLRGQDAAGRALDIPLEGVASVQPARDGALVFLTAGDTLRLSGRENFAPGRTLLISDPGMGQVTPRFRDLASVRFHPVDAASEAAEASWEAFGGGGPLIGTVVTTTGAELTGLIRWDADEEYSWEILDGNWREASYDVELGKVASIERMDAERGSARGARVTLLDGRVLELTGSNDVNTENKGVMVRPARTDASSVEEGAWVRVRWSDFRSVRFRR